VSTCANSRRGIIQVQPSPARTKRKERGQEGRPGTKYWYHTLAGFPITFFPVLVGGCECDRVMRGEGKREVRYGRQGPKITYSPA